MTVDGGQRGSELLRLRVRARGIEVGRAVDVAVEPTRLRAVGIDVRCGDEVDRFLPFAVGRIGDDEISIESTLVLLDPDDVSFYRGRTQSLRALRGAPVARGGSTIGTLADVVFAADGRVTDLVVKVGEGERALPFDDGRTIRTRGTASAA